MASMMIFSLPLLWPSLVIDSDSVRFTYSIPFLLPIAHIAMTGHTNNTSLISLTNCIISGSIYTTMAVAIERYFTVCHPFFKISHNWSPSKYIIPILIFAVAYNLPKFAELEVIRIEGNTIQLQSNQKTDSLLFQEREQQPTALSLK
jgi:hypothetical protein